MLTHALARPARQQYVPTTPNLLRISEGLLGSMLAGGVPTESGNGCNIGTCPADKLTVAPAGGLASRLLVSGGRA